jgi:hypothetical protein
MSKERSKLIFNLCRKGNQQFHVNSSVLFTNINSSVTSDRIDHLQDLRLPGNVVPYDDHSFNDKAADPMLSTNTYQEPINVTQGEESNPVHVQLSNMELNTSKSPSTALSRTYCELPAESTATKVNVYSQVDDTVINENRQSQKITNEIDNTSLDNTFTYF